jgi:hypothetical protein
MTKGRAVAIVPGAAQKSELPALTRKRAPCEARHRGDKTYCHWQGQADVAAAREITIGRFNPIVTVNLSAVTRSGPPNFTGIFCGASAWRRARMFCTLITGSLRNIRSPQRLNQCLSLDRCALSPPTHCFFWRFGWRRTGICQPP